VTVFRCSNSQTAALITVEQSLLGAYDFCFVATDCQARFFCFFLHHQLNMSYNYVIPVSTALSHEMQGVPVIYGSPLSAGIKTVQA